MNTNRFDLEMMARRDRQALLGMMIGNAIGGLVNTLTNLLSPRHDAPAPRGQNPANDHGFSGHKAA